jgi:hypothetical protein
MSEMSAEELSTHLMPHPPKRDRLIVFEIDPKGGFGSVGLRKSVQLYLKDVFDDKLTAT